MIVSHLETLKSLSWQKADSSLFLVPLSLTGVSFSDHRSETCTILLEHADLSTNVLKIREVKFVAEFYSSLLQETKAPQHC